jgi:hypothetical protein
MCPKRDSRLRGAIFATLTAAFAFAAVQKREILDNKRTTFCVLVLSVLLAGGIYAFLRLYYYGLLSGVILGVPVVPSNQTLTEYWRNVTLTLKSHGGPSTFFYVWLGLGQTIQSIAFSLVLGFVWAVGVASYSIGNQGWWNTFRLLPQWLKGSVYVAGLDYLLEITLVRGLLVVLLHFQVQYADTLAVLSSLVFSFLIVVMMYDRLDRLVERTILWIIGLVSRRSRYSHL